MSDSVSYVARCLVVPSSPLDQGFLIKAIASLISKNAESVSSASSIFLFPINSRFHAPIPEIIAQQADAMANV